MMQRSSSITLVATVVLAMGCGGGSSVVTPPPPPPPSPVATVTLNQTAAMLAPQQTVTLTATTRDASGNTLSGRTVGWRSSVPAVAAVDATGVVTGVAPGVAQVTATSEGVSASATITVAVVVVPVASVTLNQTAATLVPVQTVTLVATTKDASGNVLTGRGVTWTSTAPGVATADNSGLVSAVSAGSTTITATSEGYSASATVTVNSGAFLGPAGGTATGFGGNASVTVPAAALTTNTAITIAQVSSPPADARLIANTAYDFGPTGTTFATPVTLNIKYDASTEAGRTPAQFRIHKLVGGVWTLLAGGSVNTTTRTVSAPTSSFSTHAVLQTPVPVTITSLLPSSTTASTPGFLLAVNGSNFATGAVVQWNGSARTTTFVSSTQIVALVTAADVASAGTAQITVVNPGLGGTSTPQSFAVGAAVASVSSAGGTCGLKTDGRVFCWGATGVDPFGTIRPSPVLVPGGLLFRQISTGHSHRCGVTAAGAAYCWGPGTSGELGSGTTPASSDTPLLVVGGLTFGMVSAGTQSSCGITVTGAAYCWGRMVVFTPGPSTPQPLAGGLTFATLAVGGSQFGGSGTLACGLTQAGKAYCWGIGNLGNGVTGTTYIAAPVAVAGNLVFISISVSNGITGIRACGVTVAGAAYCWGQGDAGGANSVGALGDGSGTSSTVPVLVSGGQVYQSISVGETHTCALSVSGAAWCWGQGAGGVLGQGVANSSPVPVQVGGGLSFASVSAGVSSTCAVTLSALAYCWGNKGFLGDGSTGVAATPVAVSGGLVFTDIAVMNAQTCGVTAALGTYCWGSARRRGDPLGIDNPSPTILPGGAALTSLAPGLTFMCGLTAAGAGSCWGDFLVGTTGTTYSLTPVGVGAGLAFSSLSLTADACGVVSGSIYCVGHPYTGGPFTSSFAAIPGGAGYAQVVAVGGHLCGLLTTGAANCVGYNPSGEVGDGTRINRTSLTLVIGGHLFSSLTAVDGGTCGVDNVGTVICWGEIPSLGGGSTDYDTTPAALGGGLTFTTFAAHPNGYYACGIATGNLPECFGDVMNAPLGTTLTTSSTVPRAVMGPAMVKIVLASGHACGLTAAGAAYCWGNQAVGNLGNSILGYVNGPVPVAW